MILFAHVFTEMKKEYTPGISRGTIDCAVFFRSCFPPELVGALVIN
jgi:hypothetical protein